MKLHLKEESSWTGTMYDLIIGSDAVVFAGFETYRDRFPAKFSLREGSLERLEAALKLLELESWKASYRPEDVGSVVDDGGSWTLDFEFRDRRVLSNGVNAYPSFRYPAETSLHEERWHLLKEAVFSTIGFSVPFGWNAKRQ
ncbi:hypothetical protein OKA05_26770 [Luteolibacter arcticus]|uniref:Uncharacterized protein n=1 Tax=Luteolibacter arcticus TaxID=1581411 RepID=A0ABT3GRR0_9BACT|nr:hypothetical protein [Luteolibacter arcticus]MCW1926190.1 hypothetical protein [Luteolibacter arcticus]